MHDLSVANNFLEINENLGDMFKYVANEPSVGLYYIQQHVQNAVPNVVRLKNNLTETSSEVNFHAEDIEDSITMTKTMKECGFPIVNEMIQDIKTSLIIMSSKHPVRGVISPTSSSYQVGGGSSSWGSVPWARNKDDSEKPGSYLSSVFKSAKEKAVNLAWPQQDLKEVGGNLSNNTLPDEPDVLPVSSQVEDEVLEDSDGSTDGQTRQLLPADNDFDEFRAQKEALLEEWLTSSGSFL
ncbi:hypothetical protein vseg_009187 [Gypsophila vaccaria]